jgi:hypothetical protein
MKGLSRWLMLLAIAAFPHRGYAPPPFSGDMRQLPGKDGGKATSRWLAPFVRLTEAEFGQNRKKTVTWYSPEGQPKARRVDAAQSGYVDVLENGENMIIGVNSNWEFALPKEDYENPMVTGADHCTEDSHVFVHEFSPDRKQLTLSIYVDGKLANKAGPFLFYRGRTSQLGEDGSTALLTWKDASQAATQLVTTDSKGKVRVQVDCEETDRSPIAGPDGVGALLPAPGTGDQAHFFSWYTEQGKVSSVQISPNPWLVGWAPGTQKSVFSTSLGFHDYHYRMIDWTTGNQLWDIPLPAAGYPLSVAVTSKLVIFAIAELYKGGPWQGNQWVLEKNRTEWIRAFYAVSAEDGHPVAQWRAHYASRLPNDHEHFMRLNGRLYFLTADDFVEISEEEILSGKGGWVQ